MTKRWSSGRENLPIFHDERPLSESLFIITMLMFMVVMLSAMVIAPILFFI